MKSNKGAVTLYVILAMLTISAFLMAIYIRNANAEKVQTEITAKIKNTYEEYNFDEVYETLKNAKPEIQGYSVFDDSLKIETLKNDAGINVDQTGKRVISYAATTNAVQPTQWQSSDIISLSDAGDITNGVYLWIKNEDNVVSDYYSANVVKVNKIYGKSEQNGAPSLDNPVEVQSVGEYDESTNKYKISVSVNGKNYLNPDIYNTRTDLYRYVQLNTGNKILRISLTEKDPSISMEGISFGFTGNGSDASAGFNWIISNGNIRASQLNNVSMDGTTLDSPMNYISLYPNNEQTWAKVFQRFDVQVEINSNKVTPYEPYIEPATTNIYLEEPLRSVGNYADCIDFENKKVIRNIYEYEITGSESGWFDRDLTYNTYGIVFRNGNLVPYNTVVANALSNYFTYGSIATSRGVFSKANGSKDFQFNIDDGKLNISKDEEISVRLEKWIEWLKSCHSSSTPVKINYILETPTEETIDIPNMPRAWSKSNISIDTNIQPSNLEFGY